MLESEWISFDPTNDEKNYIEYAEIEMTYDIEYIAWNNKLDGNEEMIIYCRRYSIAEKTMAYMK